MKQASQAEPKKIQQIKLGIRQERLLITHCSVGSCEGAMTGTCATETWVCLTLLSHRGRGGGGIENNVDG